MQGCLTARRTHFVGPCTSDESATSQPGCISIVLSMRKHVHARCTFFLTPLAMAVKPSVRRASARPASALASRRSVEQQLLLRPGTYSLILKTSLRTQGSGQVGRVLTGLCVTACYSLLASCEPDHAPKHLYIGQKHSRAQIPPFDASSCEGAPWRGSKHGGGCGLRTKAAIRPINSYVQWSRVVWGGIRPSAVHAALLPACAAARQRRCPATAATTKAGTSASGRHTISV